MELSEPPIRVCIFEFIPADPTCSTCVLSTNLTWDQNQDHIQDEDHGHTAACLCNSLTVQFHHTVLEQLGI